MPGTYTHWESTKALFRKLLVYGFIIVGGFVALEYWLTPEKERVVEKYNVSQKIVVIDPRPHGCDFDDAPLGNKHCHFEKKEDVLRDDQGTITAVYLHWDKVEE